MARDSTSTLLSSLEPCATAPAEVTIGHVQLRDVVICPHEKGIVSYPCEQSIVEHDLITPNTVCSFHRTFMFSPRKLVNLKFPPNTISALVLPDTNDTLLAAGGQNGQLHLSYFRSPDSYSTPTASRPMRTCARGFGRRLWESTCDLKHMAINNSVMLTSMNFARSNQSSVEPRIVVSHNENTVKFFDIAWRKHPNGDANPSGNDGRIIDVGQLRLDVPVNHSSISPDGRTLLCVGDSSDVHLHRITGGANVSFTPISKLSLSSHIIRAHEAYGSLSQISSTPASFSTAFSADGSKFAVASQEGIVVVWDVRSTKPLKIFNTDKSRSTVDMGWDWSRTHSRAPGWGVRSVKFSPPGVGREVMTFTEHTSLLHVVDARTFETEEIVQMPGFDSPSYNTQPPSSTRPRSTSPAPRTLFPRTSLAADIVASRVVRSALDSFRVPLTETSATTSWTLPPRRSRRPTTDRDEYGSSTADEDPESIAVIPPFGDVQLDSDFRRLLGGSRYGLGLRSLTRPSTHLDVGSDPREPLDGEREHDRPEVGESEMDIDELENDCISSRVPSRAGSPAPAGPPASGLASMGVRPLQLPAGRPGMMARRESAGPYASAARRGSARRLRRPGAWAGSGDDELDIAGMCFDPTGTFVYVGTVEGVAEWRVRGAEQRWWTEPGWA
ncbi:uncharacterized protein BXZ73DRAFT_86676 [Epithele typhae]|uniref:uncharacterized protein n=1 Tax=Epithele typhae TaxID=378194 RepID=UPI0020073EED|nr:uncharacterized protein BXZ73DRAFT_86676 [Epithele typhae]KAH9945123.1 hypothetical protein BXZ73DRAFT_86676 [Epithele typhae]